MAFGLSPKYITELPAGELSGNHFLVLLLEAAKQLNWNIGHTSEYGFVAYTKFSMSSWAEEVTVNIEGDHAALKSECTGNQMMDWGKNKRNIESFEVAFAELKNQLMTETLDQKYEELKKSLALAEAEPASAPPTATKGKLTNVLSIFWPTQGYFVTPIIVNLNIAVFVLMVISGVNFMLPDTESLLQWGANLRSLTLQGEYWRLLTCCFLHIGILHLLFNMYALVYIGLLLEPYMGKLRFAAAYLLTGIAASTVSLWMHEQTVSAGASGAIFGMYGVFVALLTTNIIDKSVRKAMMSSILVFVVYNLANGVKAGIDNAAHIGGLVSGFAIGYLFYPSLKNPNRTDLKFGSVAGVALAVLVGSFIVCTRVPNTMAKYEAKMRAFVSMENMALEVYHMPKTTSRDSLKMEIKDRGLYYWNEMIKMLNELDRQELPDELHARNRSLIYYCELRIKSYNYIYKAVDEDTDKYKDSIQAYNEKIQSVINGLKGK
ncbi:rhomboid family intramembrane serine protease [Mucilaginibacter flavidus]|uniref:rhomboid family intramembrane serine protease n=1 Tax=Mucilaginibacter flavidus TaxID=2949309 RepID=UPI0020930285|nr:rhomboid family intramembrane serine protease [Mucilaginibacter flavidus]MCO5950153.1 rhomboid family intramembrane serine protease [Mucilaginibacter flavidus]